VNNVINLTRPITPHSPAGTYLPWEAPYRVEDIVTLKVNGANLFHITMGSGAATRLLAPNLGDPEAATTRDLAPERLLNREATVVRVTPAPGGALEADRLRAAIEAAAPRHGDAVVLVTGWGDTDHWRTDEQYYLDTPFLPEPAAETLAELLSGLGVDLLLTDCAYLDQPRRSPLAQEWISLPPWLRPPWPSDATRVYLDHYRPDQARRDWAATLALTSRIWSVVGLVGCGALPGTRTRLTIAPLPVEGVGEVPCTVIAFPTGDGA